MDYSTAWRRQRRLFAQYIPNSASAPTALTYRPRQISSAHHLLRNLLKTSTPSTSDPYSYRSQMRHVFANVLLGIAYGYDVQPEDDSHIDLCERSVQLVNIGINPGTYLVNLFPIREYTRVIYLSSRLTPESVLSSETYPRLDAFQLRQSAR